MRIALSARLDSDPDSVRVALADAGEELSLARRTP